MTISTECYEVSFGVIPPPTVKFLVMNLKLVHAAAILTFPSVSLKDLWAQLLV